jgi:integrase
MFFDARAAKQLKPGQHMVIAGCLGLRLVASESRKTWAYRYKSDDGKMKQISFAQWPNVSVQEAVTKWQELRNQKTAGTDPVQQRKAERVQPAPTYTVAMLVEDYVTNYILVSRKTPSAVAAQRSLAQCLESNPKLAAMPAVDVTRGVAFDVIDAKKATPTAAHKLRSLLGAAWEYALDSGRIGGDVPNWWRSVMLGRLRSLGKIVGGVHQGKQTRVLQSSELSELLAWLPNMHELGRDAVVMYLWTCTRGAEFLAMRPEHVTKVDGLWWWTVPKALTKNAKSAVAVDLRVPLFGRALEVVLRRSSTVGSSGLLFEDARGEQYTQHDMSTYVYSLMPYSTKVANRSGSGGLVLPVTNWSPHDLRRSSRTLLAGLGCPNEVAEAILGHVPAQIVGVYNAYRYDAERSFWLSKLSDKLDDLSRLPDRP